jgi:azobenzene reductase
MKIAIISGSQRANSKSLQVAHNLAKIAEKHFDAHSVLDLHQLDLPFWNEGVWEGTSEWDGWKDVAMGLNDADAFIFIAPEWHGMATPALKNFLMLCTDNELAHKPALLVSVSASINGVYPISELRMTGSKNNHVCFLPDHLIFRNIDEAFSEKGDLTDAPMLERSKYTMSLLAAYADALKPVHLNKLEAGKPFRYGM